MNYALKILTDEKALLEKCLSEWHCDNHPEARKVRDRRLSDLNNAIKILTIS